MDRLILESQHWYGWQMMPGYLEDYRPYYSPILVHEVIPQKTGKGILKLSFFNGMYAQGAQDFELNLRVLKHHSEFMLVDLLDKSGRAAVISSMNFDWLSHACPHMLENYPTTNGEKIFDYLSRVFRVENSSERWRQRLSKECLDAIPTSQQSWFEILTFLDDFSQEIDGYRFGNAKGGYEKFLVDAETKFHTSNVLSADTRELLALIYLVYRRHHATKPHESIDQYRRLFDAVLDRIHLLAD